MGKIQKRLKSSLLIGLGAFLFSSLVLAEQVYDQHGFTYLQAGLSVISFDEDIEVMNPPGFLTQVGASYSGAAGLNLAGSVELVERLFLNFEMNFLTNDGHGTEINLTEVSFGGGGYLPLTPAQNTLLVGQAFVYLSNIEVCNTVRCEDIDDDGFGLSASIKHHFSHRLSLEGGVQYLAKDLDNGSVGFIGLHAGGLAHGLHLGMKFYDDAILSNLSYRYTF